MADLTYIQATVETKIVGQDSTGNQVNYVSADANGNMLVKDYSDGPVAPGTVASASSLVGGQFNTALPTLTNAQQSAVQLDSSGRVIVRNSEFPSTVDTNYGTVGANTLRGAAQIGNATGAANFGAGATGAQTLRTTSNTSDGSGNALTSTALAGKQLLDVNAVPTDGLKQSYSASVVGLSSAALATDIFNIKGSGTKTIRITRIEIDGTTTAGSGVSVNLQLIKRSTANSGGTTTSATAVPHDSTNASATAAVVGYTANPTLGTATGTIRATRFSFVTTGAETVVEDWEFGVRPSQCIVLRGISESLSLNFGGVTVIGAVININVEWTEES